MFYKQDKLLSVQKVQQNLGQDHHMFSPFRNLRFFHKLVFVLFYYAVEIFYMPGLLLTYFGNFIFGFFITLVVWFSLR